MASISINLLKKSTKYKVFLIRVDFKKKFIGITNYIHEMQEYFEMIFIPRNGCSNIFQSIALK